jgi:hypothetical protein
MPELMEMTKVQLQEKAKELGLKFVPQNTKEQLKAMIEAKEGQKEKEAVTEKPVELGANTEVKFAPVIPPDAPIPQAKTVVANPDELVQEDGTIIAEWRNPAVAPFRIHYAGMKKPLEVTTIVMAGLDGKNYRRHFYRVKATKDTMTMFKGFPIHILTQKEFDQNIKFALYTADQTRMKSEQIHIKEMLSEGVAVQ